MEAHALALSHVEVTAKVLRCGCGDPDSHSLQGLPCPTPRAVEDLGVVGEWDSTQEEG